MKQGVNFSVWLSADRCFQSSSVTVVGALRDPHEG